MAPHSEVTEVDPDIDSRLDALTFKVIELTQELLTAKLELEKLTKEGFFLMAKAR